MRPLSLATVGAAVFALVGCGSAPAPLPGVGASWPEADALFRRDAAWRGGDSAYSVDLGDGRVLWLFGDSFVGEGPLESRAGRTMVRNTIGIQRGYDPSRATLELYAGEDGGAFFSHDDERVWLWPGPGVRLDDVLLLFFRRVAASDEGLGFRTVGSEARLVENPDDPPPAWRIRPLALPSHSSGARLGSGALLVDGPYLHAYAPVEPGVHDLYLARWPRVSAARGDLSVVEWRTDDGWSASADEATVVVADSQTELSVHRTEDGRYLLVEVDGFGAASVVYRTAPTPWGPWSDRAVLFRPPERGRNGVLIYSAKAHPELRGGRLVVTYCTNHLDFWTMAADLSLYFPRFVRVAAPP